VAVKSVNSTFFLVRAHARQRAQAHGKQDLACRVLNWSELVVGYSNRTGTLQSTVSPRCLAGGKPAMSSPAGSTTSSHCYRCMSIFRCQHAAAQHHSACPRQLHLTPPHSFGSTLGASRGTGWTTRLSPEEMTSSRHATFCQKNGRTTSTGRWMKTGKDRLLGLDECPSPTQDGNFSDADPQVMAPEG